MVKFKFSDIGEGLHEGTVAKIYVKQGESIKEGQPLFSVETDKVTSDIPSPATGSVDKILISEGQTIHVGEEIFHINEGASSSNEIKSESPKEKIEVVKESAGEKGASVVGEVISSNELIDFRKKSTSTTNKENKINNVSNTDIVDKPEFRRRNIYLKFHNLGNNVNSVSENTSVASATINKNEFIIQKISPIRNAIAKAIKNSWNNVGYTNLVNKINISKLWDMRKNLNIVLEKEDVKLTFLPFIFRAITIALKQYPIFAAKYDEKNNTLVIPNQFNIGFASDTKDGLKVPVIHNADNKSIIAIAKEINALAKASRDNTIKPAQMQNGDFTITNYGSVGSLFGVPVINYPEIAIAGVGAIIDEAVVNNGKIEVAKVMYLTIAGDHRWIDGADIGRFALRIKELLENPEMLGVY